MSALELTVEQLVDALIDAARCASETEVAEFEYSKATKDDVAQAEADLAAARARLLAAVEPKRVPPVVEPKTPLPRPHIHDHCPVCRAPLADSRAPEGLLKPIIFATYRCGKMIRYQAGADWVWEGRECQAGPSPKTRQYAVYGMRPDRRFKGYRSTLAAAEDLGHQVKLEKDDEGHCRYPNGVEIWLDEVPLAVVLRGGEVRGNKRYEQLKQEEATHG
jgi:hypothetical protein